MALVPASSSVHSHVPSASYTGSNEAIDRALVQDLINGPKTTTAFRHQQARDKLVARLAEYRAHADAEAAKAQSERSQHHKALAEQDAKHRQGLKEHLARVDRLWLESDIFIEARDGIRIPARKQALCDASEALRAMLEGGFAESSGVLRLHIGADGSLASAEAVQLVVKSLQLPPDLVKTAQAAASLATTLEVLRLGSMYQATILIDAALGRFTHAVPLLLNNDEGPVLLEALVESYKHACVGGSQGHWRKLRSCAATGVAKTLPQSIADRDVLKQLPLHGLNLIVKEAEKGGAFCYWSLVPIDLAVTDAALAWMIRPSTDNEAPPPIEFTSQIQLPSGATEKIKLAIKSVHGLASMESLYVTISGRDVADDESEVVAIRSPVTGNKTLSPCYSRGPGFFSLFTYDRNSCAGRCSVGDVFKSKHFVKDGRLRIEAKIRLSLPARRLELVRVWLTSRHLKAAKGAAPPHISPPAALACLHGLAHDISSVILDYASREEVDERIARRAAVFAKLRWSPDSGGGVKLRLTSRHDRPDDAGDTLDARRTALSDQLAQEPPCQPAAVEVAQSIAGCAASAFEAAVAAGQISGLDAASLSLVLRSDRLVCDEKVVVDAVLAWAREPGRDMAVVDKVLPLVRFPIVPNIDQFTADMKELWPRSKVLQKLLVEGCDFQNRKRARPDKHDTLTTKNEVVARDVKRRRIQSGGVSNDVPVCDTATLLARSNGLLP